MKKEFRVFLITLAAGALLSAVLACQSLSSPGSPTLATGPSAPLEATVPVAPADTPVVIPNTEPAVPPTEDSQETAAPVQPGGADSSSGNSGSGLPAACAEAVCISDGFFLFQRPVGEIGRKTVDTASRYASYVRGLREAHYGVKFLNTTGNPVVAAAAGIVVVAGDDLRTSYGSAPDTYGNLVILRHELPGLGQPVFTLYGQLSEVMVQVDQNVAAGEEIGKVGSSGRVKGSTLHFEIRLGENALSAARNPELWLAPLTQEDGVLTGTLAGKILDADGKPAAPVDIQLEMLGAPGQGAVETYYLKTYADRGLAGRSPWEENFAITDLPPGSYQISFYLNGLQQRVVEVQAGKLTSVNFPAP